MRKLFVLPMVLAVFFADFGAFGATARSSRGNSNATNATSAPVAARAAVRGAKPASTTAAQPTKQNAPVAARAATRNAPKTTATASAGGAVAARAGAKQKVINMGTKISSATTNTVLSQECQDAYYGCMDSFCMLENTTGGRCKCSDKNAEYDQMLTEIQNMDQQSYVMQTEGVSLLKMGKSADEVYAMAQSAADKVTASKKESDTTKKSSVDLSAWNKDWFDDDSLFEEEDLSLPLESELTSKTGDGLHATAARICTQQIPSQCKASASMLRMVYVQKIQSDCAAYSNSLKQQQMESTQKLQTARQSLRDTALEKYNEANKYDLGGCVREYNACMQREDTCGEGFTSCVTLSASDNLQNNNPGTVAKQTTIQSTYSSITLSISTMEQLMSKRVFCESILEQCVNVKDQVWNAFLRSAAPTIKTAESDVESNLRMNCIKEVSECFRTGCAEQMDANKDGASYDMCLSNPDLYKSLCKPKLEPCLLATGGTYDKPDDSSLWNALKARLASMKVDACTQEVKDCLLSEDRCGKDYAGCIGLTTYEIGNLCPFEKLTACMDQSKKDPNPEQTIRDYVASVAQGLALNIDTNMLTQCQSALKTAMLTHCGAEDTCPNAQLDESMFKGVMSVKLCNVDDLDPCSIDPYYFKNQDELIDGKVIPMLVGKVDIAAITYGNDSSSSGQIFTTNDSASKDKKDYNSDALTRVTKTLTSAYNNLVSAIESDPKVEYCIKGRDVQGWTKDSLIVSSKTDGKARFPNLTQSMRNTIGQQLINALSPIYFAEQERVMNDQFASMNQKLSDRINEIVQMTQEEQKALNAAACLKLHKVTNPGSIHGCSQNHHDTVAEYDSEANTCTVKYLHYKKNGCGAAYKWYLEESDTQTKVIPMPSVSRDNLNISDTKAKKAVDGAGKFD